MAVHSLNALRVMAEFFPPSMEPLDTTAVILDTCEANTRVVRVEHETDPNASGRI